MTNQTLVSVARACVIVGLLSGLGLLIRNSICALPVLLVSVIGFVALVVLTRPYE